MSRKTDRAAAFAVATLFLSALAATGETGAVAQDQTLPEPSAPVVELPADQIRFVPGEVVQPSPDRPATEAADTATREVSSLRALVAEMDDDAAPLSRDLNCLATAIYFEARGETLDGQLAVGRVVVNRSQSGRFPANYCGVVAQRGQFSFVSRGRLPSAPQESAAWRRATAIARIAHQDMWDSPADEALFFHARRVKPSWAGRKLTLASIDGHIFYR